MRNEAQGPKVVAGAIGLGLLVASALGARGGEAQGTIVYPSGDELPANHLKFYVHFPEPMRQGVFLEHCRLVREDGSEVAEPFRETELWSEDGKRLTLWLHPGRQKDGVNLNVELGPVLEEDRGYRLIISGQWLTARGQPLGADVTKAFGATKRVIRQLDMDEWKLELPAAGTREALAVTFPAAMDHALLGRVLRVEAADKVRLLGKASIDVGERGWRFVPEEPWRSGSCRLVVDSLLEDLAGNSLARPFEVDLQGGAPRLVEREVTREFRPRPR